MKLMNITPEYTMAFSDDKGVVAKLNWSSGSMVVDGNLEHGAEIFFDFLKPYINTHIEKQLALSNETIKSLEDKLYMAKMQNDIYKKTLDDF